MAIGQLLFPVRSPDREAVPCFASFRGNDTGAPTEVKGRGVTVTRVAIGVYRINFGHEITVDNVIGLTASHLNRGGDDFLIRSNIGNGVVDLVTWVMPGYTNEDLTSDDQVYITVWVKNAR